MAAWPASIARRHKWIVMTGALAALAVLAVGRRAIHSIFARPPAAPFQNFTIHQIRDLRGVVSAALSPDGKYIANVKKSGARESLWLQNMATASETQLIAPGAAPYSGLAFSPDDNYVYFEQQVGSESSNLLRVPVLGGASQLVARNVSTNVTFSPVGGRIAYLRVNDPVPGQFRLLTAAPDGSGEAMLFRGPTAQEETSVAWAPDGRRIAWSLIRPGNALSGIAILDIASRNVRMFATFADKFVEKLAWMPDGSGLVVRYAPANSETYQLGFVSYPGARFSTITRAVGDYVSFSLSSGGNVIVALYAMASTQLDLLSGDGRNVPESASPLSYDHDFHKFNWDSNNHLLVAEVTSLLRLSTGGRSRTVLVHEPNSAIGYPAACGERRFVVFNWFGHQSDTTVNVWRVGADGSNPVKLTHGKVNYAPVCSPDGRWVYFLSGSAGRTFLERVPLEGGGPSQVVPGSAAANASIVGNIFGFSPDGKELACLVSVPGPATENRSTRLELISVSPAQPARLLEPDPTIAGGPIFTPDGKALAYPIRQRGVSNIWVQPLDGSPGRQITHFARGGIIQFAWSPNGKRLAVLRFYATSNVVLLRAKQP